MTIAKVLAAADAVKPNAFSEEVKLQWVNEAEGMEQGMDAAKQVLTEVSKLDVQGELAQLILSMYEKILSGATLADLRRAADAAKAASLTAII